MQSFDHFMLISTPAHLALIKLLLSVIYLLHMPYVSMLIGFTFFSLCFHGLRKKTMYAQFAFDLVHTPIFNVNVVFMLGILPLLISALIYAQILYGGKAASLNYLIYAFPFIVLGLIAVLIYRTKLMQNPQKALLWGVPGFLLLSLGYILFISSVARFHDPEKWSFMKNPGHLLASYNVIANNLIFLTSAFAISGIGIIFFFTWSEKLKNASASYSGYVIKFGLIVGLIFTLSLPLFITWELITLPDIAFSNQLMVNAILLMIVLAVIAYLLSQMLQQSQLWFGTSAFVLFLVAFCLMIINQGIARENALREHSRFLAIESAAMLAKIIPEREAAEGGGTTDYAKGEDVYKRVCSTCHRFDRKVVGPPYMTVMPRYESDIQTLVNYVNNPQRMNPEYPSMPRLGLKLSEVEAVAGYLLKTYQEEYRQ